MVRDDRHAMQQVIMLAERVADIIGAIGEIADVDRQSLIWHLSLIRKLASERRVIQDDRVTERRFLKRSPDDGAA